MGCVLVPFAVAGMYVGRLCRMGRYGYGIDCRGVRETVGNWNRC